jgi:peptidoglycan/LPS O-acetylase OafA/YrhL
VSPRVVALGSLVVLLVLRVAAIVVAGGRPALDPGTAPRVLDSTGIGIALVGALVLLVTRTAVQEGLLMVLVLAGLALVEVTGPQGPNFGLGALVLVGYGVLVVVAVRLARPSDATPRR